MRWPCVWRGWHARKSGCFAWQDSFRNGKGRCRSGRKRSGGGGRPAGAGAFGSDVCGIQPGISGRPGRIDGGEADGGSPCPVCGSLHHPRSRGPFGKRGYTGSGGTGEEGAGTRRAEEPADRRRVRGADRELPPETAFPASRSFGALTREAGGAASGGNTAVEPVRDFAATDAASAAVPEGILPQERCYRFGCPRKGSPQRGGLRRTGHRLGAGGLFRL